MTRSRLTGCIVFNACLLRARGFLDGSPDCATSYDIINDLLSEQTDKAVRVIGADSTGGCW